ncbi:MAG: hypothetical protein WAM14_22495 [Candidatus Nitrosopolaris sp.]
MKLALGDDNKKSFWTSLPGILTGVAAVIVAVGGILAAYNHVAPPSSPPSSASNPPSSSPLASSSQVVCGTQLPGVILFGAWRWSGTVNGSPESGVFTFKSDCTYENVAKSGITTNDEGSFLVNSSPYSSHSITFTNKITGKTHTYDISNISENSFHASNDDYTVNLDFIRAS